MRKSHTLLAWMKMLLSLWKTIWQFLKNLNIYLTYHSAIPILGIYTKEVKAYIHIKTYIQMNISYTQMNLHRNEHFYEALYGRAPTGDSPNIHQQIIG